MMKHYYYLEQFVAIIGSTMPIINKTMFEDIIIDKLENEKLSQLRDVLLLKLMETGGSCRRQYGN